MIMCKYGCLSDTDENPDFGYEEIKGSDGSIIAEYTCEPCLENEVNADMMVGFCNNISK